MPGGRRIERRSPPAGMGGRQIGAAQERLLDEVEPVLAEEHLVTDEKGRRAEDAALHGGLGIFLEPRLDRILAGARLEAASVEPAAIEHALHHRVVAHVETVAPHRRPDDLVVACEIALLFGHHGAAHQLQGASFSSIY